MLHYLSSLNESHSPVELMVLESSPILEAFGNAKTARNTNSSRFVGFLKILLILFRANSWSCTSIRVESAVPPSNNVWIDKQNAHFSDLLEKGRVTSREKQERYDNKLNRIWSVIGATISFTICWLDSAVNPKVSLKQSPVHQQSRNTWSEESWRLLVFEA